MRTIIKVMCESRNKSNSCKLIENAIDDGSWVQLLSIKNTIDISPNIVLPKGPGIIISSGGSTNGPHQTLQPAKHLDQAAYSLGNWLKDQGIDPSSCIIVNPLPLNHMSGLMPWWRSRVWKSQHIWLRPALLKDPIALRKEYISLISNKKGPLLISLVPTQLHRLLSHQASINWLKSFDIVWIGGAKLTSSMAEKARKERIRLSPCYGATETAAMITLVAPKEFLNGIEGTGSPLADVKIRINLNGILEVKSSRNAIAQLKNGKVLPINNNNGWWESGDLAIINKINHIQSLEILGRVDTACNTGGITIFPENIEEKILKIAKEKELSIASLLLIPIKDKEWGEKLIALLKWDSNLSISQQKINIKMLQSIVNSWPPYERPYDWKTCEGLKTNDAGKWERTKWNKWLEDLEHIN